MEAVHRSSLRISQEASPMSVYMCRPVEGVVGYSRVSAALSSDKVRSRCVEFFSYSTINNNFRSFGEAILY